MYDGSFKYDENVAKSYDHDRFNDGHWQLENLFMVNFLKDKKIESILDLPVGTGRFLGFYDVDTKVFGIDISEHMLDEARLKNKTNAILSVGDVLDLNFADNYFEVSVSFRLFHLLPFDLRIKALAELYRVTKKTLLIQFYVQRRRSFFSKVRDKVLIILKDMFLVKEKRTWLHIKSYPITYEEINNLLENSNISNYKYHKLCNYEASEVVVLEVFK